MNEAPFNKVSYIDISKKCLPLILNRKDIEILMIIMDYENKSVFNSMTIHCLHNTMTALLLLSMFYLGVA